MIVLTIAEIKDLAEFCGLILTQECKDDKDQDDTEVAVDDSPEGGLIDIDQAKILHHAHVAYFYEYPEEGSMPLGPELTKSKDVISSPSNSLEKNPKDFRESLLDISAAVFSPLIELSTTVDEHQRMLQAVIKDVRRIVKNALKGQNEHK